jgi:hypothetical protein
VKWFLPPLSFSRWFAFSFFVLVFAGVAFRVVCCFEGCCGSHWLRFQGGLQLQKLLSVSSGAVLRAARCFKYCFGFIVFGFWSVTFSAFVVNFAANNALQGTGQRRGVLVRCLPFKLFRSAACVAAQRPAPEFRRSASGETFDAIH